MTTPTYARDYLYELCTMKWADRGPIEYEDRPQPPGDNNVIPPILSVDWMRLKMVHEQGRQATLTDKDGVSRYRRTGTFYAQTFSPLGSTLIGPEEGAMLIEDALQRPKKVTGVTRDHCVLLRNVRINEVGSDGHWYQFNVVADFEYDEVK